MRYFRGYVLQIIWWVSHRSFKQFAAGTVSSLC